jgi:hypothetical protein
LRTARAFRQRRLQRDKDFTGERLTSFREVILRHGLPGVVLAIICFSVPSLGTAFVSSLANGLANPAYYAGTALLIFLGLNVYAWSIDKAWSLSKTVWIIYLGALSFWEEWVFRLALPQLFEGWGASVILAAILSASLFGAAHYYTLRWKWQWCVGAALGGLMLSRQMEVHQDLLVITAMHWIATYLNTPRPPGESNGRRET